MGKYAKLLQQLLSGRADTNIPFDDLCRLLIRLGFNQRIRGDHHIFSRSGVAEILNLQPLNGLVKAYQAKQVRQIIMNYQIGDLDAID